MRTTTRRCRVVLGSLMICGLASAADANDSRFYAAFDLGVADYPSSLIIDVTDDRVWKRTDESRDDLAWTFTVGYRFNDYFALEAGVVDLGKAETALVHVEGPEVARGKLEFSARGKTLALLAHRPSGNWDPYFKAGAIHTKTDRFVDSKLATSSIGPTGADFRTEHEEVRAFVGVGVRYAFTQEWAVSLAVDHYIRVNNRGSVGGADITSPRIGVAYRF
jgi:opacity protein-like surface antigen